MKIKDLRIQVIARGKEDFGGIDATESASFFVKQMAQVPVLTIVTDDGIEGTSLGTDGLRQAQYLTAFRPLLLGEDPMYVEKIWQKMWAMSRIAHLPDAALGTIDIALWDIIGKATNLPIYKLLGAYRDKVRAYASVIPFGQQWKVEDFVKNALECKARGFTAYKLHMKGTATEHLAVCRALREAVGDEMVLMLDPVGEYDRREALMVGRELEKLNFYWLEEPIPDADMAGLIQLCNALDIPIAALEALPGGIYIRAQYIARGAADIVRSDALYNGGITPLKKTASLAEAFDMKCEIHYNPSPLANAANLHVMCSMSNCDFYEWVVPEWQWDFGVKESIKLDGEGYVHVPKEPGLGLEVDWEYINSHTVQTL